MASRQRKTSTASEPLPPQSHRGAVVAFRIIPDGDPIWLDEVIGPSGPEKVITVGAGPSCDITIETGKKSDDDTVSWCHCLLHRRGDVVLVEDAGILNGPDKTRNGTWIDTVRLRENQREEIRPGQVLYLGRVRLLACNDNPEECLPNITANDIDGFCSAAVKVYGTVRDASDGIGPSERSIRRWRKDGRWRRKKG